MDPARVSYYFFIQSQVKNKEDLYKICNYELPVTDFNHGHFIYLLQLRD